MITALVTNGALLTQKRVDALAKAGLASVYISIDAASYKVHLSKRGLPGLSARIRRANTVLKRHQIPSSASVMSRLVDYPALPKALRDLGFGAVTFSYPLPTLLSSDLACAESPLVDFTPEELHASYEAVKALIDCYRDDSVMQHGRHCSKRRHARSGAGRFPGGLEPLGRSPELGLRAGSNPHRDSLVVHAVADS